MKRDELIRLGASVLIAMGVGGGGASQLLPTPPPDPVFAQTLQQIGEQYSAQVAQLVTRDRELRVEMVEREAREVERCDAIVARVCGTGVARCECA